MVAIALALTLAIAASLWFSVPAEAIFVTSTVPSSMTVGRTYSFDVQVDIEAGEAVNIDNIKLIIYNSNEVPVRLAFFTPDGTITHEEPSGYVVSVTRILPGYSGSAVDFYAYGYGYDVNTGFGYHTYDPAGTGAGYGYGEGSSNTTQLKYRITIKTTGMAAGSYRALVAVEVSSTLSFLSQYYPLTVRSAPAAPAEEPGVTDVSDVVDEDGVFTEPVTAESEDGNASLTIGEGTTGLTAEGEPISEISIVEMEEANVPPPPEEGHVIGLAYDFGPDDATFDEPITISFTYDPDNLPEGVSEEDLVIAVWDEDAGEWVELPSVVDTENNTITATVDHFTAFAVVVLPVEEEEEPPVGEEEEEEPPVGEEEEEEEEEPPVGEEEEEEEEEEPPVGEEEEEEEPPVGEEEEEEEITPPELGEKEGVAWWVWLIVGLASATVVGLLVYFLWWKRRFD